MSDSTPKDVLVVGGGLVGACAALALAERGARVSVLDRGVPGHEASQVAAGMLAAQAEVPEPGPGFDLALSCLSRYPAVLERLAAHVEGGPADLGFVRSGSVLVARDEAGAEALGRRGAWHRALGIEARELTPADLRQIAPEAAPEALSGLHFPADARVSAPVLTAAALAAARSAGVEVTSMAPVAGLSTREGRVVGVRLADGERIAAERVLLAAGAWSAGIGSLPLAKDSVVPCRGLVAVLQWRLPPSSPVLYSAHGPVRYLCPQPDGTVVAGGTADFVGFRREAPAGQVAEVLAGATALTATGAGRPFHGVRVGFRPFSRDDLPLLGPSSVLEGLFYATGHGRTGILCGPPTAWDLAPVVLGEAPLPEALRPFDPARLERSPRGGDAAGA
ncbi:FAD-dependent oxidoreductase [Myxococcota bacterium]|nr:FAD-dependent oxidoreductase [Myxococcota bacterium]